MLTAGGRRKMKCSHCGKKIADGLTLCPYCGRPAGNDDFESNEPDNASDFSGGDFDPEPVHAIRKKRKSGSGKTVPLLIALCAVPAVVLIAMLLFLGKGPKEAPLPVFAVSTGHSERLDEGRGILLNELLVIPADGISRSRLEELLEPMGGAPAAYLPELNQYQVKFNTTTRDELDRLRATLLNSDEILRADYNLVLSIRRPGETHETLSIAAGSGEKIGILGDWTPEQTGTVKTLYLPSLSFRTEEQLKAETDRHPDFFSESWKTLLQQLSQSRTVTAANIFCYETREDGSLYTVSTSAAFRCQLTELIKAGTEWIAVPLSGPNRNNDAMLDQETAQMDLLISALEENHPGFVILVSQSGSDWIPSVLAGSGKAKEHSLAVCTSDGKQRQNILNLTGTDLPVYLSDQMLKNADFCVMCADSGNAAILAAACAAGSGIPASDRNRQTVLSEVKAGAEAFAADRQGTVRPVPGNDLSGDDHQNSEGYLAVSLQILDEITGLPVQGAEASAASGGQTALSDPEGWIWVITENGHGTASVKADGYQGKENLTISQDTGTVFLMPDRQASGTGTIHFSIGDMDGQASDGLTVMLKDPETGEIRLSRKAKYDDRISFYPGVYDMVFTAYNRTSVTVHGVSVAAGEETTVSPVSLSIPSDISGTVSGLIKDAMTGDPLSGVTLSFHEGVGASETDAQKAKITNQADGKYTIVLPAGEYTMIVSKAGYKTASMTVQSRGESTIGNQNCTITPTVPEGQVRIVLEWGMKPKDLDSHLFNVSQKIHIFFPDKWKKARRNGREIANLDVDDRDYEGPETTTILQQLSGQYIFIIHDYTNGHEEYTNYQSKDMAESGAKVSVYVGSNDPLIFEVPDQPGIVWEVFTLENGIVTPSNRILDKDEWDNLMSHQYTAN